MCVCVCVCITNTLPSFASANAFTATFQTLLLQCNAWHPVLIPIHWRKKVCVSVLLGLLFRVYGLGRHPVLTPVHWYAICIVHMMICLRICSYVPYIHTILCILCVCVCMRVWPGKILLDAQGICTN